MTRYPWMLAAFVLVTGPLACVVTLGGPDGSGGFSGSGGGAGGGAASADACNPVTGAGCPADGSTCDLAISGFFACFPPPNTVDVCGDCDDATLFCGSDLTCVLPSGSAIGSCYRYCCTDADCGAGALCDTKFGASVLQPASSSDAVGFCVTSTSVDAPACGPPASSPSGGACVGGFKGSADGGIPDGGAPPDDSGAQDGSSAEDGGAGPSDAGNPFGDGGHGGRHDGGP